MAISSIGGFSAMGLICNPIQKAGTVIITALFLNAMDTLKVEAFSLSDVGGYAMGAFDMAKRVMVSKDAAGVASAATSYATNKYIFDKCFDVSLMAVPQFGISIRAVVNGMAVYMEYKLGCEPAKEDYKYCLREQSKNIQNCDSRITSRIKVFFGRQRPAFPDCYQIQNEELKNKCILMELEDYNQRATEDRENKEHIENYRAEQYKMCLAEAGNCVTELVMQLGSCGLFATHLGYLAARIFWETSKSYIPAPIRGAAEIVVVSATSKK